MFSHKKALAAFLQPNSVSFELLISHCVTSLLSFAKFRYGWAITVYLPKYQRNYVALHSVLRSFCSFIIHRLIMRLVLYSVYEATAFECLC